VNIGTKAAYATRTVFFLALHARDDRPARISEISEGTGVPANYLAHLLPELKKAGFARSRRGATGGYALARQASSISVAEVIEAMQGGCSETPCSAGEGGGGCPMVANCALEKLWRSLNEAQQKSLQAATFEDLVNQQLGAGRGSYTI